VIIVVTGTDTGVGKTVATAALAAYAEGDVVVVKPVQTGVAGGEETDADVVRRLSGRPTLQLRSLADPLAPDTAARLTGEPIPPVKEYAERIRDLDDSHDVVLVEGSGGLLVRLDTDGGTLLDLAADLAGDRDVRVYVVARAGLGTLNHTELTVGALRDRGLEPAGLIVGAWPDSPGLAERCNLDDLPRVTGVPLVWVLPEGVGGLDPAAFATAVPTWRLAQPAS
jgi:dethiobiotin synthase